ncbi:nuclear transport factor 2 family protein [Streptomyces sp. NPDC052023]|uniref:nuclear transport factor 2 family protein n=1 Tax=Streptomyces sp. NPDC052023 TaxID=3365681 RepID=UPI0037D8CE97
MTVTPGGSATTTRAVIDELLRRIGQGGAPEHIAELYAAHADWKLSWPDDEHGRASTPWITQRGTNAAAAHYRELAAHHVPGAADTTVERVLVDGADAVVLGEIRQTALPTGRAYRARFALHLTVEGGLIVRHHVYEDSLSVARAFSAS